MFAEFSMDPATPRRPVWAVRDMVYGVALLLLSLVLVSIALQAVGPVATGGGERVSVTGAVATLAFELLFGGAVVWLAYRRGLHARDLGFVRPRRWGPAVIAWLGAYVVLQVYRLTLEVLRRQGVDVSLFDDGNVLPFDEIESATVLVIFGVAVVLVAPLAEELFFRALLFRGLRGYWRLFPSLLASGAAFGIFHVNPSVVVPFAAIGMLFGWANEQTGSLWTSISAHTAVNGISFFLGVYVLEP